MPLVDVAQRGFSGAAAYHAHRPTYPKEAVDRFFEVLEIRGEEGASVVDVGAGTGIFTELLAAQPENFQITAVEPHDGMRKELESRHIQGVETVKGTAEDMPTIHSESVRAVTVAQAFHWMANMDTLRELHRILKPTAVLGMIWNVEDYNAPLDWNVHSGWESAMRDEMWAIPDGHPRFRDLKWKAVFDEQNRDNPFSLQMDADPLFGLPIGEQTFEFENWLSKEDVWKRFNTYSQIANLDEARRAALEKRFWTAIDSPATETDAQGRVAVHGKTVIAWTTRIPGEPLLKDDAM